MSSRRRRAPPIAAPAVDSAAGIVAASVAVAAVLLAAGCAAMPGSSVVKVEPEVFGSTTTHARTFDTGPQQTCEAARRALLSQGFTINSATSDRVVGRKNFQPKSETHVEIELNVVCAPEGRAAKQTIAFVTALQDQYALKKSNNSASVGVPVLGSLSLPIISSDDAMVKVASETIASERFYDRFYRLLDRYLAAALEIDENEPETIVPVASSVAGIAAALAASAAAASAAASGAAAAGAAAASAAGSTVPVLPAAPAVPASTPGG